MKKIVLLSVFTFVNLLMFSQVKYIPTSDQDQGLTRSDYRFDGSEPIPETPINSNDNIGKTKIGTNKAATYWETIIGLTVFDLQTNSSIQNRLALTDNYLSAAFTMSQQTSTAGFTDRGTGYNYGINDINQWDNEDFERIESERTGWPSMVHTGSGKEIVISHQANGPLWMSSRDVAGEGSWDETNIPTNTDMGLLWPRAAVGGDDNEVLHVLCVTTPQGNEGASYEGFDGALLYFRSQDGGETWDIQDSLFSSLDSTVFSGFNGDTYSIAARGQKVAFGVFNDFRDSFMMISEDNGDNWEYTSLVDFPVDDYTMDSFIIDLDEDELADTLYNTDGSGAVFITEDMQTHATFGNMRYLDELIDDEVFTYFPFTDGLEYWNENMGADSSRTIAGTMDMNDDGVISLDFDLGLYYVSLTGMPSMSEDADGTLYVSYSGVVETHTNGSQHYRHVFLLKSEDGGETWTVPVDATPDLEYFGYESVFASMAPTVDDYIHLIYMSDFEPGLHVRGDEDSPASDNDIIYMRVTPDLVIEEFVGIEESKDLENLEIFPNPTQDVIQIYTPDLQANSIQLVNINGETLMRLDPKGELNTLDMESLSSGFYFLLIENNGELIRKRVIKQ